MPNTRLITACNPGHQQWGSNDKKPQHARLFKIPTTKLRNTKYADRDRRMIFSVIAERGRGKRSNLHQPRGSWIQENAYSQLKTVSGMLSRPTT